MSETEPRAALLELLLDQRRTCAGALCPHCRDGNDPIKVNQHWEHGMTDRNFVTTWAVCNATPIWNLSMIHVPDLAAPAVVREPVAWQQLRPENVEWVVNSIAELGVKIGDQFFFCYKGRSLVYQDGELEDGLKWRPVGKREFGECIHPVNYDDLRKCGHPHYIGTVNLGDSDEWKDLPAAPP